MFANPKPCPKSARSKMSKFVDDRPTRSPSLLMIVSSETRLFRKEESIVEATHSIMLWASQKFERFGFWKSRKRVESAGFGNVSQRLRSLSEASILNRI